ncbi:MAG: carboxypeptidase regulatory-like domain-containing protein [Bryobacteraceae bacterium]
MLHARKPICLFRFAFFVLAATHCAQAQVTSGSVTGSVLDATGAAVTGVNIKLTNTGTAALRTTTSDNSGNYQFLLVPPGVYVVEATSPGFRTFRRDGILVEADRSLAVPITLSLGQVSDTIEVVGGTPLLEPNTSSLGTVMDSQKIIDLPLNGRNPMGLANLIPTVRGVGYFGGQVLSTWRTAAVNISGGQPLLNSFLIDGVANDKIGDAAGAMTYLTVDATQEFKVLTNSMSAEYGRTGGGVISVISRSGTNQYHGSLFEFLRNDNMNANNFFSNIAGAKLAPLAVNQYGGTFGGPIKKDRAFFFFNYEGYRERRAQTRTITVPSPQERAGDFSGTLTTGGQLITVYDPLTTITTGTPSRQAFPGNVIPANRITQMSKEILRQVPLGNLPGLANSHAQNLYQEAGSPINRYTWGVKTDYQINAASRFAIRYTRDVLEPWRFPNFFNSVIDTDGRYISIPRHSGTAQYTHSLSPSFLLEARAGINTDGENGFGPFSQDIGKNYDLTALGFPQSFVDQRQRGHFTPRGAFPVINVPDLTSFGAGTPDQIRTGLAWDTSIMATKILSNHTLKFGYDKRFSQFNFSGVGNTTFNFSRGFTQGPNPNAGSTTAGFGTASFLLGMPASASNVFNPDYTIGQHYHAAFLQEDWKATRSLTLNLGVRWEFEAPQTERFDAWANFDPNLTAPFQVPGFPIRGVPVFRSANGTRYITDPKHDMFAPRIGYAWQLRQRLVARGGYGIVYIPVKGNGIPTYPGYAAITTMVTSLDGGLTPRDTVANPFPGGLLRPSGSSLGAATLFGGDIQTQMRDPKPGYMQQWNFTLQFEPKANWLLEGAYVGSKGTHVLTSQSRNLNQLDPTYFSLGNALNQSVTNPFFGIITSGPLSGSTVPRQQLLRPYPQYNSVTGGWSSLGDSVYHAFALKIEKRFSQGFSVLAAYTLSKTIDAAAGSGGQVRPGGATDTGVINWYNLRLDRSKGIEDVPQRLVLTALWALPWFKTGPAPARFILGGWQLNAIGTFESGRTIALSAGGGNRPNVVAGQNPYTGSKSLAKWFNTAAYAVPAPFTYGNASRTIPNVSSDGVENIDFSLIKDFKIREGKTIQFRAEAFNLANTPVFEIPVSNVQSTTFGVVTATAFSPKPREMQLALKFTF